MSCKIVDKNEAVEMLNQHQSVITDIDKGIIIDEIISLVKEIDQRYLVFMLRTGFMKTFVFSVSDSVHFTHDTDFDDTFVSVDVSIDECNSGDVWSRVIYENKAPDQTLLEYYKLSQKKYFES